MIEVDPRSPKSEKGKPETFTKCYSSFPRIFAFFGFDFIHAQTHKPFRRAAFCLLKIAVVVLVLSTVYCLHLKSLKKVKSPPKKAALNFNVRTELTDLLFAIFALCALFIHEKSLTELFSRAVFRSDDSGRGQTRRTRISFKILSVLWILFSLIMPTFSVGGKAIAELSTVIANKKFEILPITFMQTPLHTFSTLFCGLYALVCLALLHRLSLLAPTSGTVHCLGELEKRHRAIRFTQGLLERSFSGVLPLLYTARLGTFVLWAAFLVDEPGTDVDKNARRLYLVLPVIQTACLLIPPIFVNVMLESSLNIDVKNKGQQKLFKDAYTPSLYNDNVSISPRVQLWTIHMAFNSPRLTAGRVPISNWMIVKGLGCLILVVWYLNSKVAA